MDTTNLTDSQVVVSPDAKMSGWKKIALLFAGMIILAISVIIYIPSILNTSVRDIAPINDNDLLLKKVFVADRENAYFDLIKLDKIIYESTGASDKILDMVSGKIWDEKLVEELVLKNEQAFKIFTDAAVKSKFQDPVYAEPIKITPAVALPPLNSWRRMSRLSAVRALYLAKRGKDKEAMEEAFHSIKIGQKIQDSQVSLIEYLVALSMKDTGIEIVMKISNSSKLQSAELISYARTLNEYYKNEDGLISSFKGEYMMQKYIIDGLVSGNNEAMEGIFSGEESARQEIKEKIKNSYYFQPNKTISLFAEYTRNNIKSVRIPCGEIKPLDVQMLAPSNPAELYVEENAIGKILHDILAVGLTNTSIKKCEEDLLIVAAQTTLAMKAFKNDTGNYPNSLQQLAPRYLNSVPIDQFDGKPIKYSAIKKIIYSVGKDMKDSGGSTGDEWRKMPDPTFTLGF